MNLTLASIAISFVCSILLFVIKGKNPVWLRKATLYPLGRLVVVFWGISFLLLGRYFHQIALPLSSFVSTVFFVLGVQVTLWAIGISLQILGNVPSALETLPESSFRHRPSDSGWSPMKEQHPIEATEGVMEDEKGMGNSPGNRARFWLRVERIVSITSILASLATAAGIFFVIYQIRQSNTIERRRFAIEAIRQTRSAEFIKAFRQVKVAYKTGQINEKDKEALIDSLNHVMNVYDDIAVIYVSDIADKCIIKDSVYSAASEMSAISDALSPSPPESRRHFKLFLKLMEQEPCDNRHLSPPN